MKEFVGLAILTTNWRKDIDRSFLRRIHFVFNFPRPDADDRRLIGETILGVP